MKIDGSRACFRLCLVLRVKTQFNGKGVFIPADDRLGIFNQLVVLVAQPLQQHTRRGRGNLEMFSLKCRGNDGAELLCCTGDMKIIFLLQILIERKLFQDLRIDFVEPIPRKVRDFDHKGVILGGLV